MERMKYVSFRDKQEIIDLLDKVVEDKGIERSDFIREAIRKSLADLSFFSEETKKALGIQIEKADLVSGKSTRKV